MEFTSPEQITKGKQICVKVEEALLDVLVVSYRCGIKVFQGILLDVSKKNCAYGVVPPHSNWPRDPALPPAAEKTPENAIEDKFHAVRQRHTYFQESPAPPAPAPRKAGVNKSTRTRDQNVRMRRLRPRQVLCYHCRAFCTTEATSGGANKTAAKSQQQPSSTRAHNTRHSGASKLPQPAVSSSDGCDSVTSTTAATANKNAGAATTITTTPTMTTTTTSTTVCSTSAAVTSTVCGPAGGGQCTKALTSPLKMAKVSLQKLQVADLKSETASIPDSMTPPSKTDGEYQAVVTSSSTQQPPARLVLRKRVTNSGNETAPPPARKQRKVPPAGGGKRVANNKAAVPPLSLPPPIPPPPAPSLTVATAQPVAPTSTNPSTEVASLKLVNKTSPVIKISFANPQGKESILKIPPRAQSLTSSDNEDDGVWHSKDSASKDASAKAAKKALKKAKKDAQRKLVLNLRSPSNHSLPSAPSSPAQQAAGTKSRHHHKHKLKRKRKHRDDHEPEEHPHKKVGLYSPSHGQSQGEENSENDSMTCPTNNENRFSRKKVSICLKRLNAKAYARSSPKYVVRDTPPGQTAESDEASDCDDVPDFPKHEPGNAHSGKLKPLTMRFSSTEVKRCVLENGRDVTIGDVVWGKVQGFPWWPGKVMALTECQRDNGTSSLSQQARVSWYGSTTSSNMPCTSLVSFLDEFKVRYNRKKRGSYREAIRQATLEVEAQKGASLQLPTELGCLLAAT